MTATPESRVTSHEPRITNLSGVPSGAEALLLSELLDNRRREGKRPLILHIAVNDRNLETTAQALEFFAPGAEVIRVPAWDCMPYDRASPMPSLMAARMRALTALVDDSSAPRIVLTTASSIVQKIPPRAAMRESAFRLEKGGTLQRDALSRYLLAQGYRRAGKAMEPGEFALRGGIIDLVPSGMSEGVRIDLFGDDIESLRTYDLLSQITQGAIGSVTLYPISEVLLGEDAIHRFREGYRSLFGAVSHEDPLYESVSHGRAYPGMEHWLPLFYERVETLFDYCQNALVTLDSEAQSAIHERQESILDYYQARTQALTTRTAKNSFASGGVYHPVPPDMAFLTGEAWDNALAAQDCAVFSPFISPSPLEGEGGVGGARNSVPRGTTPHPNPPPQGGREIPINYRPVLRFKPTDGRTPFDLLKDSAQASAAKGKATVLACFSAGSLERLQTLLGERSFHCVTLESWKALSSHSKGSKTIYLAVLPLESGFESDAALILSEQDVLGERIARARPRKKSSELFLAEAANFAEGELVVHKEHGIGRFEGLVTLHVSGAAHDCLKIIYDGDDKLFLPVENIEIVSRFGLEEEGVRLDKLGGASWQARTARLKQRIKIAAEALLKTAAQRQLRESEPIDAPLGAYEDFCARFPYVETEDQARAITEVLENLQSGKPMDRLVCGDVGFGKTEVALRAAFVVVANTPLPP